MYDAYPPLDLHYHGFLMIYFVIYRFDSHILAHTFGNAVLNITLVIGDGKCNIVFLRLYLPICCRIESQTTCSKHRHFTYLLHN